MAGVSLSQAAWRTGQELHALCQALDGSARFVGGAVRDTLVGQEPKDVDLATPLAPTDVIDRLKAAGIKVVPTGLAHGTVTAVLSSGPVEVTTLRRDVSTDGRRATIAFTDDWQADAARRDFTINALFADPATSEIFDYFGGVDDLKAGMVRFIGEPVQRIAEDHLRILRYFRFHARFGHGAPHVASLEACAARANDLMALSRERIALEIVALLNLADPAPVIALMLDHGILRPVLPEIKEAQRLGALVKREAGRFPAEPMRRLAALLPPDPALAEAVANRLKLSNANRKRLMVLAARADTDVSKPKVLAYRIGLEAARDRILLGGGDPAILEQWVPPRFPMSGGALVARGIKAGPAVARLLQQIETAWIDAGFPNQAGLAALVDAALAAERSGQ